MVTIMKGNVRWSAVLLILDSIARYSAVSVNMSSTNYCAVSLIMDRYSLVSWYFEPSQPQDYIRAKTDTRHSAVLVIMGRYEAFSDIMDRYKTFCSLGCYGQIQDIPQFVIMDRYKASCCQLWTDTRHCAVSVMDRYKTFCSLRYSVMQDILQSRVFSDAGHSAEIMTRESRLSAVSIIMDTSLSNYRPQWETFCSLSN